MTIHKKMFFISDLHLEESRSDMTEAFLRLVDRALHQADALYILGDLFESWIGDDDATPFHQQIMATFKAATQQGLPIFIMRGNRDFLIGDQFQRETGCTLLEDPKVVSLYGTPVLLMHGDTLCTHDKNYQKMRARFRHPLIQFLFLHLPLRLRKNIAARLREKSKQHVKTLPDIYMDVAEEEVLRVMQQFNMNTLIHGHTHRQAIHKMTNGHQLLTRIVLPDWDRHPQMLEWHASGDFIWADV